MLSRARVSVSGFSPRWSFVEAVRRASQRVDPEWSAALFDEHFLRGRAAPILARYLDGPTSPDPEELAEAWVQQLWVRPEQGESLKRQAIPIATRYLLILEEEMQKQRIVLGSLGFERRSLSRS